MQQTPANGVGSKDLQIITGSHQIADGNTGVTDVLNSGSGHTYVSAYASGTVVASQWNDTAKHEIVAYERGSS